MLKSTFLHVPGVGRLTERGLWESGIRTWENFLDSENVCMTSTRRKFIEGYVRKSIECCEKGNYKFLEETMPPAAHWRAYRELARKGKCCFLDIETTGLSRYDRITMIGLYDGKESRTFVRGKNLEDFPEAAEKYKMVVTFNGKCFDIPFIRGEIPQADMDMFHVDLRYELGKLGYSGGLKRIEKTLGIERSEETRGMDGFEAVCLWKRYRRGDREALKLLADYNREDVVNLKQLMEFAYRRMKEKLLCGFQESF